MLIEQVPVHLIEAAESPGLVIVILYAGQSQQRSEFIIVLLLEPVQRKSQLSFELLGVLVQDPDLAVIQLQERPINSLDGLPPTRPDFVSVQKVLPRQLVPFSKALADFFDRRNQRAEGLLARQFHFNEIVFIEAEYPEDGDLVGGAGDVHRSGLLSIGLAGL